MIPHSRPYLPKDFSEVTERLRPGWVAGGPCVAALRRRASDLLGGREGVATNSGTTALVLALRALEIGPGDEVVIPAYVCAAVMSAVHQVGGVPVLADVEPGGVNLDPEDARRRLTPRTKAILVAHMFGQPARMEELLALGPPVIEDCAQCFGGRDGDRPLGSRGAVAITSFFATKVITTGQGGLACSPDAAVSERLHDLSDYDGRDDYRPRLSVGMSELDAALGLWQLDHLAWMLDRRREIGARYRAGWESLGMPLCPDPPGAFPYRFTLRAPDGHAFMASLCEAGVDAKPPVFRPLHHYAGGSFPESDRAHREIVSVPCYPALSAEEGARVLESVARIANKK